jgi:hypothetical protein
MFLSTYLPLLSALVSFIFAVFVFKRYAERRGMHLLFWGIGMVFYGIGGLMEGLYGLFGWSPLLFRVWYLFGAILVAAWLGQGTVYLLAKKRAAMISMIILVVCSVLAAVFVFTFDIQQPSAEMAELSGKLVYPDKGFTPRKITPFFNIYGTLGLVGGAVYSAWIFFRKRVLLHRVLGNVLIALGGIFPAFGGSFSRMGIDGALYISEFLGAVFLFLGFLRATTPMKSEVKQEAVAAAD